jgi:hypothetical protein
MILKQMCIWLVLFNFMIDDARNHEREVGTEVLEEPKAIT